MKSVALVFTACLLFTCAEATKSATAAIETVYPTSFDCAKASSITEYLICHDPDLAAADREYAVIFKRAKAAAADKASFTNQARERWKAREQNCKYKPCVAAWFAEQKALLEAPTPGPDAIREVDFLNFTYQPKECLEAFAKEGIGKTVRVRNGEYNTKSAYYNIGKVLYGDLTGNGIEEAVVSTLCSYQETANPWYVLEIHVFTRTSSGIKELGYIGDERLKGDYAKYFPNDPFLWENETLRVSTGALLITKPAGGAHCCPEFDAIFQYRWNGSRFVLASKPQRKKFNR